MAKWKFGLASEGSSLSATVDYSDKEHVDFTVTQYNDKEILKEVERDRYMLESGIGKKQMGWRKAFTIPDIVAIEMMQNHGIDVHEPTFMHDPDNMKKLKYIMRTEYPHLLIST